MPGFVVLAAAALAASAQPAAAAPTMAPQSASSAAIRLRHEVCYALATGSSYPTFDLAGCLSFDKAPEAAFRTQVCSFLRESEQLQDYRFASYGDCVHSGFEQ
ncbi:MAG: hypothetical protein ACJ8E3_04260 [Sphingomicrobium sp.]